MFVRDILKRFKLRFKLLTDNASKKYRTARLAQQTQKALISNLPNCMNRGIADLRNI